jgi:hypothetical protein
MSFGMSLFLIFIFLSFVLRHIGRKTPADRRTAGGAALHQWLCEVEDSLVRMIRGVLRFAQECPARIYRFVVETACPVVIRACRVLVLACIWLMLLFGPFVLGCACRIGGFWTLASLSWVFVAITGSVWGLKYSTKKRKAADGSAAASLCAVGSRSVSSSMSSKTC